MLGNESESGFRLTGATDYRRLRAAAETFGGRSVAQFEAVLDWGVGCGRVARYALRDIDPTRFTGCDIDRDNVAWCRDFLGGSYSHTNLSPPLPFGEGAFDLVYGVSVFTHLREPLQDAWLGELRRILRFGGLALVTTHGQTALDFGGSEPAAYVAMRDAIARDGIVVSSRNSDLDGAVEQPEEYVNVFHSEPYVRRHWPRWLEVVAIVPGYIHTHDLVVLRRRAD